MQIEYKQGERVITHETGQVERYSPDDLQKQIAWCDDRINHHAKRRSNLVKDKIKAEQSLRV